MSVSVGLIGARGYVGQEMLTLLAGHPEFALSYASSRQWAGRAVSQDGAFGDLAFEDLEPGEAAARAADVVILGLPNGKCGPFAEAITTNRPNTVLLDLSADYRHVEGWTYGLTEVRREALRGATRIANPGCYATAAQLALAPLIGLLDGPATAFGVSGYSGAGTTPSRRNNVDALQDNIMPYGLVDHGHEREIAAGLDWDVRFAPAVAGFFRGLVVTARSVLRAGISEADIRRAYHTAYHPEPFVDLLDDPAEPRAYAKAYGCGVSLPQIGADGRAIAVTAALDNLLKGAASQALQNLNLALGFDETLGLTPTPSLEDSHGLAP